MISRTHSIVLAAVLGALISAGCSSQPRDIGLEAMAKQEAAKSGPAALPKAAPGEKIQWLKSYEDALKQSKASGHLIMADFTTDWCQWCKVLDAKTYPDPTVVEMAKKLVPLKLDAEKDKEGIKLAKIYGISTFPRIMFFNSSGDVAGLIDGYVTPAEMTDRVQQVLKAEDEFRSVKDKAIKDPKDYESQARLASMAAMRLDIADAEPALKRADQLKPKGGSLALTSAYNNIGAYYGRQGKYDQAIQSFRRAVAISSDDRQRLLSLLNLGSALINAGQKKEAISTLEQALKEPILSDDGKRAIAELLKKAGADVELTEAPPAAPGKP